jgi:hypothetical protein
MTRLQCAKCPWKVSVDPHDIPDGYCVDKHRALEGTIADRRAELDFLRETGLRIMTCHETDSTPCVGWLHNQMGPGNNLGLRLAVMIGRIDADVETVGEQHLCFEDTLPK